MINLFSIRITIFLCTFNYTYSIISLEKTKEISPVSLDYAIQEFSSIKSINVVENILPQKDLSTTIIEELEYIYIYDAGPISKKIKLNDSQYKEYIQFLKHLIEEISKQKITIDWEKVNSLKHNQLIDDYPSLLLNGQNDATYKLFDRLLRKKVDYMNKWGWFTDYTSTYNLQGKYSIGKNSRNSGNISTDNHELIVTITPTNKFYSINKLPDVKIIFTFLKKYNELKNEINTPFYEKFKLFDVVLEIPHLIKETDLHTKVKNDFPSLYNMRNSIKTCLSLKFNYES